MNHIVFLPRLVCIIGHDCEHRLVSFGRTGPCWLSAIALKVRINLKSSRVGYNSSGGLMLRYPCLAESTVHCCNPFGNCTQVFESTVRRKTGRCLDPLPVINTRTVSVRVEKGLMFTARLTSSHPCTYLQVSYRNRVCRGWPSRRMVQQRGPRYLQHRRTSGPPRVVPRMAVKACSTVGAAAPS